MIKRHTKAAMALHWFNAACWLFLLATGFGLFDNEALPLTGGAWSRWMRELFGSPEALLSAHILAGSIWASVCFLFGILGFRKALMPFVTEILTLSPIRDVTWLFKKGVHMTLGSGVLRKKGIDPKLPDQGFYNVGQKLFAVPSLFGGILIGITGIILALSNVWFTDTTVVQWAIFIHFLCVGLVFAGLLIHIYMAAIAPGERPALISMFTGTVPEDYAEHHHRLWYLERSGK
jgi:formate dehydrogenase subunit gamma